MGTPWIATQTFLTGLKEIKEREKRAKKTPDDHERHLKETSGMIVYPHPENIKILDFTQYHSKK